MEKSLDLGRRLSFVYLWNEVENLLAKLLLHCMVVCAEPVLPADGRRVWEPVDLDAGAEGAEGDGVTLVAHDHVIPHRAGTTGKILKVSGDLHLIAHNCPQLPTISTIQKSLPGKVPT